MGTMESVRMPPGPRLPRALQTLGFLLFPPRFIEACHHRYGDVVSYSTLFDPQFVMVYSPEGIKQVFQAKHDHLRAGEANALLGTVLGERSVLLLDGDEHLRQRKLMLPSFHGKRMRAYEKVMRDAADDAIDSWPVGPEFALLPSMQHLTLDVIMSAVFGVEAGERREELKRRIRAMIAPVSGRLAILVFALSGQRLGDRGAMERFMEQRRAVDEMIFEEIARRREVPDLEEREDVFSTLLLARDEEGRPMTDQELRDELVTLLVAGHETTATGLAWAFDLLMHSPRVLERLRASLAEGDESYLDAVVKETLRARPVIPAVGRVVRGEPFELLGWTLPPGTEINPSIVVTHRRADRYPRPHDFRPERFLEEDPPDTYTWVPFGGGPRRCLGASFALFEMRVVVRRVLERAALQPAARRQDRIERRGITLTPRNGVRVVQTRPPMPAVAVPRQALVALFLLAALGAAGCGDDEGGGEKGETSTITTPSGTPPAETQPAPAGGAEDDLSRKPAIERPSGEPPARLVSEDIVKGKGRRAKKGDEVEVQYVGVAFSTGQEFDASWDRGEPLQFELGGGDVIEGWDRGVVGMRVGGRRKLTIPADLAYGAQGQPPAIGPNETLVFVIDLKRIR